ncbi:hypothetical protein [Neorhodopirellula lusitana]|uniref:hypothetical protein n=1 Tax=Neorhodopirellula lusitana TaxID=445327 RepID=UPI00384BEA02
MNPRPALLAVAVLLTSSAIADDPPRSTRVSVDDLDQSIVLVGRLGHPLGTMLTLYGTWGYPDQSGGTTKDFSLELTIHTVNGKRLAKRLTLKTGAVHVIDKSGTSQIPPHKMHKELDGVAWSLRAYETGRFTVMPDEYWRYRGPITMIPEPAFASSIVGYITPDGG